MAVAVSRAAGRGSPRSKRPWVARVKDRHRRRTARFNAGLADPDRRPADRVGVAIDYLRGAMHDAPAEAVAREVDALIRHAIDAVARLHAAELRNQP
ncbi:hypothetical protein FDG2_1889 [Candidatus Protofrankia californiensis]|uniref:Uncharacterized protein n=1 Tax=Candidatus Protofrankia californiensis TaxID=1839754 RepID=A0A1C3NWJ1_9ACTN|nr:hypothetical protein FDG2_1889 [Candidatus Protofrankia californiensis]